MAPRLKQEVVDVQDDTSSALNNATDHGVKHVDKNELVLPLDKRLNLLFNSCPGVTLNPLQAFEFPTSLYLLYTCREHFSLNLMLPMFIIYMTKECVCMSALLHRYFSHKGYKCSRVTQYVLYVVACLASQGGPIWWASKHRRHHAECDTKEDPHSPVAFNYFYAWMGWAYIKEGPFGRGVDEEKISDLLQFPELVYSENFVLVPVITAHAIFYYFGGIPWMVYVSVLSSMLCQVLTMFFNAEFHKHDEKQNGDIVCKAIDNKFDPLSNMMGEAYHLWHHRFPRAYIRPGIDLPYWFFIKPLMALGLIWGDNNMVEVKLAKEE